MGFLSKNIIESEYCFVLQNFLYDDLASGLSERNGSERL